MRILVTGGAGYIGSTLVPHLLAEGHEVTVLDRFYFGEESLAPAREKYKDRLALVRADVRRLNVELFEGHDAVVDLAGISNDPACELDEDLTRNINLEGAVSVSQLAEQAGVQRLVFASSCSVYGHGRTTSLSEDSPLHPVSLYAHCKADAEKHLFTQAKSGKMCITALRFATLFGISGRTRFDIAINVMTKNAYCDRRITVDGGGKQWRPFVHVTDVARAVDVVLNSPREQVENEVFNVGSDENNIQIVNLAYRVRDQVPGTEIIMSKTDPDTRTYNVSFQHMADKLGFKPQVNIDAGITEVLGALRNGHIDPDDRRWYTLKHYMFLVDVERTFSRVAMDGQVLS